MSTLKSKFTITYLFPGTLFPEQITEELPSSGFPGEVPRDCYGYEIHETEVAVVGGKEYEGDTKRIGDRVLIGWVVPLNDIPANHETHILRGNIERNSPTKEAVRTRTGNWQMVDEGVTVFNPSTLRYSEPRIWKKLTPINGPLESI